MWLNSIALKINSSEFRSLPTIYKMVFILYLMKYITCCNSLENWDALVALLLGEFKGEKLWTKFPLKLPLKPSLNYDLFMSRF